MKDADGRVLYVGKAANLRRRVSSYFERPHEVRIQTLVTKIRRIDHEDTDTALEALILEAELIKKLRPPFNVREKDDKSFLYIEITKDRFPRVLLVRGKDAERGLRFGPFTSASSVREAMHILRRIFPWNTHAPEVIGKLKRPCFDYEVGMCPGTCIGAVTREEYAHTIDHLKLFLAGKKKKVLTDFKKDMAKASRALDFEKAEKLRRRIFALQHIQDTALISENEVLLPAVAGPDGTMTGAGEGYRIEGYDISNISGTDAVGSMVVFEDGEPDTDEYRKFKIRTVFGPNDIGMLTEMLERRFAHRSDPKWRLPDLVLIDGGLAQANAAKKVLLRAGLRIPIIGIAKGPERKRNDIIGAVPKGVRKETLVRVRDEAHRFAIGYHKNLRRRNFLAK
ncbi:MAG: excinuclease ABC subunit UvrC [Chthoniobacter sp.]|nr:excinuclease ABC subunit UvrC [Chthoniobacter sp.]